jgi:hypothetical protein
LCGKRETERMLAFALMLILAASQEPVTSQTCDLDALESLVATGARTGWGSVYLGMARGEVETAVGQAVVIRESPLELEPATANVRYRDHDLVLWFRGSDERAVLMGIVLPFDELLKACTRDDLVRVIRARIGDLVYDSLPFLARTESTDPSPVWVRAANMDTGILLKPQEALYIIPRGAIE